MRRSLLPGPLLTRAWDHGVLRAPSGFDVVHATSLSTMEPGAAAMVATVHDLLWRRLPDAYPARGRAWHEAALRRALRRADRFIVPSEVVANDLCEAGAPEEAVTVIPMGSDHLPPPDVEGAGAHLARLGIRGPFLLSVGTLEPRKNQARLIAAYARIRGSLPEPWPLVMVGPIGWGEQVVPVSGVVLAGLVPPSELSAALRHVAADGLRPPDRGLRAPAGGGDGVRCPGGGQPAPQHRRRRLRGRSRTAPARSPPACCRWPPTMGYGPGCGPSARPARPS